MDPEVSKLKFGREIEHIRAAAADFVGGAGWVIQDAVYPVLALVLRHPRSKRSVGFRFLFDDWDYLPPSLALFDPETKADLPWERWPKNGWSVGNPHPKTGKPFLCLPGIREYHEHHSHLDDRWDDRKARESYRLPYIVDRVLQRFGDSDG